MSGRGLLASFRTLGRLLQTPSDNTLKMKESAYQLHDTHPIRFNEGPPLSTHFAHVHMPPPAMVSAYWTYNGGLVASVTGAPPSWSDTPLIVEWPAFLQDDQVFMVFYSKRSLDDCLLFRDLKLMTGPNTIKGGTWGYQLKPNISSHHGSGLNHFYSRYTRPSWPTILTAMHSPSSQTPPVLPDSSISRPTQLLMSPSKKHGNLALRSKASSPSAPLPLLCG
ncbi:unnamed protein product [Cyclocybe aegerita]|uniref:Uncharacterized protein n=1 Tax=Cyclocybe aegerita TaxID=1973307 RepID=A0A8S0X9W8_CYCAE|nr:unnamed protein product [Cyclocybe aegerita]